MAKFDIKKIKLISSLYKGPHYSPMVKFKDDIIENHKAFATINDAEYKLYGDDLYDRFPYLRYTFSEYNIKVDVLQVMPGIGKIFATLLAFEENPNLHYVAYADFDSLFVKENHLLATKNYVNQIGPYYEHDVVRSCVQHPFLYDMTYLHYYCMYKGITFEQINKQLYRYNSGLYIVSRNFITEKSLKDYVDFSKDIHEKKGYYSSMHIDNANFMTLPYDDEKDDMFHPSDEVYWQYLMINRPDKFICTLTPDWNFIGKIQSKKHLYEQSHVHCIDKSEIEKVLNMGVLK